MRLRNCLGIIWSVSTFSRCSGTTSPVCDLKDCMLDVGCWMLAVGYWLLALSPVTCHLFPIPCTASSAHLQSVLQQPLRRPSPDSRDACVRLLPAGPQSCDCWL